MWGLTVAVVVLTILLLINTVASFGRSFLSSAEYTDGVSFATTSLFSPRIARAIQRLYLLSLTFLCVYILVDFLAP